MKQKYTTTTGQEIELAPIPLTNREAFRACQSVLNAAKKFDDSAAGDDSWYEARYELHDNFLALCDSVGIPRDSVGEGDLESILSVLQTGELPGKASAAN